MLDVLIYGGGSVGLGIASCLLKSNASVTIVGRDNTVTCLKSRGLSRKGLFGHHHTEPSGFHCVSSLNDLNRSPFDYILICTKSGDSYPAAKDIFEHRPLWNESTHIVLFQNGWGNAEIFASFFPKDQVFNARVITGFSRPKLNEVMITVHADAIHIGSVFGADPSQTELLCDAIAGGGIPCEVSDDIVKDLWAKMLYNCALNPLGAILDVTYGKLAESDSTRMIMDHIIEEIFQILAASGYQTYWDKPGDFLNVFYSKLIPATAEHRSSTLQDIRAKKKTEIEALNGAVIELARTHQIDVPYNQSVFAMVKFIETMNR